MLGRTYREVGALGAATCALLACAPEGRETGGDTGGGDASPVTTTARDTSVATTSGTDVSGLDGIGDGLGAPDVAASDPPSHGGTLTFREIGAPGWYPSRRDPAVGPCDAFVSDTCCLARHEVADDRLTPWNDDLVMTLRGPMRVAQLAVYQPAADARWALVSSWDAAAPARAHGLSFRGNDTETAGFDGAVGTECLVDVATDIPFACGAGSLPYCPSGERHLGWAGSKLFVLLATMPHADDAAAGAPCSDGTGGNWYDAPWIGLSLGELVRAGAFSGCHCYARNPDEWWLGDGCGQFNVFEVVNDNNEYRNLEVFSTNFFGYAGYVGEGPCGARCDLSQVDAAVDLIDKATSAEAAAGAVATPSGGPGAALRRPTRGYRYFLILLDEATRTVQLALVHPDAIPAAAAPLLPALPADIGADTIGALLDLRLPR